MTREDIIYYATVISAAGAVPAYVALVYQALDFHRKHLLSSEASMGSSSASKAKLPLSFWALAVLSAVLYAFTVYGTVLSAGKRGPTGQMGQAGRDGVAGPAGAKGEPGLAGSDANAKQLETKLAELTSTVSLIQQRIDVASKDSTLLRRFIKVKDCIQDLGGLDSELKAAFGREVEKIRPPAPSPNLNLGMMHRYMMQPDFATILQQDLAKVKGCAPSYDSKLTDLNEDQLETSVPDEPKETFDQQRKYRRAYSKNMQMSSIITGVQQTLAAEERSIKTAIDTQ